MLAATAADPRNRFMIRSAILLRLCCAAVPLLAQTPSAPSTSNTPTPDLLLALVDERALVSPVMRYDGQLWHSRWPPPDESLSRTPLPATLNAIPRAWVGGQTLPAAWHAWRFDGSSTSIRLTTPVRFDAHCVSAIGLQSDYPTRPLTDAPAFPKRKVAIAFTGSAVRIQPIEALPLDSAQTRALTQTLRELFVTLARRDSAQLSSPLDIAADVPIAWTNVWTSRDPSSGDRITRVQGHMDTPRAPRFYAGAFWIRQHGTSAGSVARQGRVFLTDEDFKGVESSAPLGVVTIGARSFWLEQVNGYGSESYRLVELSRPDWPEALRVEGGGC